MRCALVLALLFVSSCARPAERGAGGETAPASEVGSSAPEAPAGGRAHGPASASSGAESPVAPDGPTAASAAAAAANAAPPVAAGKRARAAIVETDAPAPKDLMIRVEASADGPVVRAERRGDLVMLRRGDRRSGAGQVAILGVEAADEADAPIVVEATRAKTLETTRVVVRLTAPAPGAAAPAFVARLAAAPVPAGADDGEAHACRAHEDGFGGFAVLCRVATQANAASITAEDAHAGVVAVNGATTLARLDFDVPEGAAESKLVAYNAHGRGVVVRAEASFLPGESGPSLVVLSQARTQPVVRPRFGCRIPHHVGGDPFL